MRDRLCCAGTKMHAIMCRSLGGRASSHGALMESQQSRVLVQLRDLILKGEFAPGERLAELTLAEKLGASRTPVRLALASLEQEGLVEPSPARGYVMRQSTPA